MHRRSLLAGLGATALPLSTAERAGAQAASAGGWRKFELTTTIDLAADKAPVDLWLPLAGSVGSCQRGLARRWDTNGQARIVRDAHYGEPLLRVRWETPGPRKLALVETLATRDRATDPARLTPAEQRFWTAPVASLPTDGIVGATAARITSGITEPRARARAIYDWVVDNTFRNAATRGCGIGGIENMLQTGFLGGKCADTNSLMVGLSRAAALRKVLSTTQS